MYRFQLCFLILVLPIQTIEASPWNFPVVDSVITTFYRNYQGITDPARMLNFARKEDGWYLVETPSDDLSTIVKEEIYWSNLTKSYLPVKYPKLSVDARPNVAYHLQRYFSITAWTRYGYDRCRYYGYGNWAEDMASRWSEQKPNNLKDLEGLGRAYNSLANHLLHDTYQQPNGLGYARLEDGEQLDQYLSYARKAIECYQHIYEDSAGYSTLVGPASMRLFNEHMTVWHDLLSVKRPDKAKEFLLPELYHSSTRRAAALTLESCPQHALLVVNGDNDYYPLKFLQAALGARTDVKIVNQSLLQTVWYQRMVQAPEGPGMTSVGFLPDDDLLERLEKGYIFYDSRSEPLEIPLPGGEYAWELPLNRASGGGYLLSNQVWLSEWVRYQAMRPKADPLCIAATVDPSVVSGLYGHLEFDGLVYRLVNDEFPAESADPLSFYRGRLSMEHLDSLVSRMYAQPLWPESPSQADRRMFYPILMAGYLRHLVPVQEADSLSPQLVSRVQQWSDFVEPFFSLPSPEDAYYLTQIAILCYEAGLEQLAGQWEGELYEMLSTCRESGISASEAGTLLVSLKLLGYYFQESGRDTQYISLSKILDEEEKGGE